MSLPMCRCRSTMANSSAVSLVGLCRISSGTPILPTSCKQRRDFELVALALAVPEHRAPRRAAQRHPHAVGGRRRVLGPQGGEQAAGQAQADLHQLVFERDQLGRIVQRRLRREPRAFSSSAETASKLLVGGARRSAAGGGAEGRSVARWLRAAHGAIGRACEDRTREQHCHPSRTRCAARSVPTENLERPGPQGQTLADGVEAEWRRQAGANERPVTVCRAGLVAAGQRCGRVQKLPLSASLGTARLDAAC